MKNDSLNEFRKLPPDMRAKLKQFAFARNIPLQQAIEIAKLKTVWKDK